MHAIFTLHSSLCKLKYRLGENPLKYDHKQVEKKWQDIWDEKQCFKAENGSDKEKFYALVEFPYPSGQG